MTSKPARRQRASPRGTQSTNAINPPARNAAECDTTAAREEKKVVVKRAGGVEWPAGGLTSIASPALI